jgi:hypothetical protein
MAGHRHHGAGDLGGLGFGEPLPLIFIGEKDAGPGVNHQCRPVRCSSPVLVSQHQVCAAEGELWPAEEKDGRVFSGS